jgi:hypothetical protein
MRLPMVLGSIVGPQLVATLAPFVSLLQIWFSHICDNCFLQNTRTEWGNVFLVLAIVQIIAGITFAMFSSMSVQEWAIPDEIYRRELLTDEKCALIEKH